MLAFPSTVLSFFSIFHLETKNNIRSGCGLHQMSSVLCSYDRSNFVTSSGASRGGVGSQKTGHLYLLMSLKGFWSKIPLIIPLIFKFTRSVVRQPHWGKCSPYRDCGPGIVSHQISGRGKSSFGG